MVRVETLDKQTIIEINKQIPYKSIEGVMSDDNLEFVVYRTASTRGINRKAAVIMQSLIESHPFHYGNKRTGFISAKVLLEANGKKLDSIHEFTKVDFTQEVEAKKISLNKMAEWFANHTRETK